MDPAVRQVIMFAREGGQLQKLNRITAMSATEPSGKQIVVIDNGMIISLPGAEAHTFSLSVVAAADGFEQPWSEIVNQHENCTLQLFNGSEAKVIEVQGMSFSTEYSAETRSLTGTVEFSGSPVPYKRFA